MELVPRTRTLVPTPGSPDAVRTWTPGARPCSAPEMVTVGAALRVSSSPEMEDTAPVSCRRLDVPYPVATISSRSMAFSSRTKFTSVASPAITVTCASWSP